MSPRSPLSLPSKPRNRASKVATVSFCLHVVRSSISLLRVQGVACRSRPAYLQSPVSGASLYSGNFSRSPRPIRNLTSPPSSSAYRPSTSVRRHEAASNRLTGSQPAGVATMHARRAAVSEEDASRPAPGDSATAPDGIFSPRRSDRGQALARNLLGAVALSDDHRGRQCGRCQS